MKILDTSNYPNKRLISKIVYIKRQIQGKYEGRLISLINFHEMVLQSI